MRKVIEKIDELLVEFIKMRQEFIELKREFEELKKGGCNYGKLQE